MTSEETDLDNEEEEKVGDMEACGFYGGASIGSADDGMIFYRRNGSKPISLNLKSL